MGKAPRKAKPAPAAANPAADRPRRADAETRKLLGESTLETSALSHHGYFPKEIARYLAAMLKDNQVPCEVGYDMKLAESGTPQVYELRELFKDSKPFYFLAYPLEYRPMATTVLSTTQWPIKPDPDADHQAELASSAKSIRAHKNEIRRGGSYMIVLLIAAVAVLAFFWMGSQLLSH